MAAPQPITATGFDTEHAHAILRGLMEAGAELVGCLVEQARKDPVPHPYWGDKAPVDHPTEHIARCYDRITRSVRRSIALARHLDQPLRCQPAPAGPSVEPRAPKAAPAAANDVPEPREAPERPERPDAPDWNEDHHQDLSRPLGEVITEIEADLDLDSSQAAPTGPHQPGPAPGTAGRHQASNGIPARPSPPRITGRSPFRKPSG